MTVAQILIFSAIFIAYNWSLIYRASKDDLNKWERSYLFEAFIFFFLFFIAVTLCYEKMKKGCPELERVENVYKIK